ncbi:hypothetical protein SUGI_0424430 [Cryptomeria japonica]|uniref:pentatricopeptide repeat-containing protein At5g46580, chloroplastic n=1 Tax=Cryptomeria japonica TaxID=3369 RepID=UPI002408B189|nr:pentatricopeptide repeat-containing protein At5g46580, chloroplastic [Cryptomeria japonica]GLJ22551.1 hypothetical protein SUGI_0424430 [Cryptomeria japonica]
MSVKEGQGTTGRSALTGKGAAAELIMSLASTIPSTANAGTHSYHTHYTSSSVPRSNLKLRYTCVSNPHTLKRFAVISCSHGEKETISQNPSITDQLKPLALEFRHAKPSATETHDLNHGISQSKPRSDYVNGRNHRASVQPMERERGSNPQMAWLGRLKRKLDSCKPTQKAIFEVLDSLQETPSPKTVTTTMNGFQDWKRAYCFFQWLRKNEDFQMNTVIYNVTMKILRKGRQWGRVEELVEDMLDQGIDPDNITFSTVISCARQCNLPRKAVEWFERMSEIGCVPNGITYTAMVDAYSRAGQVEEAIDLYERARANGWIPDIKAFSTMMKMYNLAWDFDGALYTFQEMKALGVKPNLVVYNTMLDTVAKVEKPREAKQLFEEMIDVGLRPDQITFTCLLRIYAKAKRGGDALQLFEKMKEQECKEDTILYNTLLGMCADIGLVEEAVILFKEMCESDSCKPDSRSYTSMIDLYASRGQIEEASRMFSEMMEAGFRPNLMVCTSLIQCYGRIKRFDDVVRTFNLLLDERISPDDKFCGSLLSVLTLCEKKEFNKIHECIEKINPELSVLIKMLQEEDIILSALEEELETVLYQASDEVRKPFCNYLIDLCYKFNSPERARNLFSLGTFFGVYTDLQIKSNREWCLNLRSLSFKVAITAFDDWIVSLSKSLKNGKEIPPLLWIHTGHGNHKGSSDQSSSLVTLFGTHLRELDSPFEQSTERVGWFLATRDAAISWLHSRNSSIVITG